MKLRLTTTAIAVAAVFPLHVPTVAAQDARLDTVVVTATGFEMADVDAPYASEVHGRAEIERSGATTLYDYLSRHTSVQVLPAFGNRFTPKLDMRGYGIGDGYQNLVVTLNGRRLNNVDMVPQLIGAIPLVDVDRIEITKGSGSVFHGDGAMAGTIQIHTRALDGAVVSGYAGNYGARGGSLSAGLVRDQFSISGTVDHASHDGFSKRDPFGKQDESDADSWRVSASGRPSDRVTLFLDAASSRIDTRYAGPLSLAEFRDDPSQNNGAIYTKQKLKSDSWGVGAEFNITNELVLKTRHDREDKLSRYVSPFSFEADYVYKSNEILLQHFAGALSLTAGFQTFDGLRVSGDNKTRKDSTAWFGHGQYQFDRLTLSVGARTERVEYVFKPVAGARLKDRHHLLAWDVGANYRLSESVSLFGSYNRAFQAPDIDRFFSTDFSAFPPLTGFNDFINPARAQTFTLGLNYVGENHRLKASLFHTNLKDEIYFFRIGAFSGLNTNLDRSHKYGIELQDTFKVSESLSAYANYSWIKAVVDREDQAGGAFDGKDLPGVPRHNATIGATIRIGDAGSLNVSHTWRSKAWAANDFSNSFDQKQRQYHATDVSYQHRLKDVEIFAGVSNLFKQKNGLWIRDDRIYPVDFARTWQLGAKVSF